MAGRISRFEFYKDRRQEWRWRLRGVNGRIVADSAEGYSSKRNAENGANIVDPERVHERTTVE